MCGNERGGGIERMRSRTEGCWRGMRECESVAQCREDGRPTQVWICLHRGCAPLPAPHCCGHAGDQSRQVGHRRFCRPPQAVLRPMEVERVNIAAAARSGSGDANQLPPLPPAGCAPPPGVSAAPRAVPRRKGSMTHTYQLPLVFEALIHVADDLHHTCSTANSARFGCAARALAALRTLCLPHPPPPFCPT